MIDTIDYKNLLAETKKRMSLEQKQIKKMSLYNFLNDNISNLIIDCRIECESKQLQEGGKIRDSFSINNIPDTNEIKKGSRLILILDDEMNLKDDESLAIVRKFVESEDKIEKGIFVIKNSDYQNFVKDFDFLLLNENSDELKLQIARTSFPLMILDNLLYTGNFLNSKNLHQINFLKIGIIISLMNEEDPELKKQFQNYHFIETNEISHAEIDFVEILELMDSERERENKPILVYCFSGQSISISLCIAYLMKSKKWSLEFATGYMMKICPNFKIPAWLYTQLQRIDLKKK